VLWDLAEAAQTKADHEGAALATLEKVRQEYPNLEAAAQADLQPVQARAAELEGEISKNLAEIRDEADRVTRHLGKPPPASHKASG